MKETGSFKVGEKIYVGTSFKVYRGTRIRDNLPVIIKMATGRFPSVEDMENLHREFAIGVGLNHPNIIRYIDFDHELKAVISEDFGGRDLGQLIPEAGVELSLFLHIATQLTDGLQAIHRKKVIHKDMCPNNVVASEDWKQVRIIDFGISTRRKHEREDETNLNRLIGTLKYISPEQTGRMNQAIDYRSDYYSLGATFYHMLTGRVPFEQTEPLELIHSQLARTPVSPRLINSSIPEVLSELVMKLIAKHPGDRYQSSKGLMFDLETCREFLESEGTIPKFTLATQDISEKFTISQRLYGRHREVSMLIKAFEQASKGKSELILVCGYSGIGKTSLINQLQKPVTQARGYFISGKFDQLGRAEAYSAIRTAFQSLIRKILSERQEQLQIWKELLLAALGTAGQIIIDVIPELELIIGKQLALEEVGPQETKNRFNMIFLDFVNVFAQKKHPVTIFLDDIQWADQASLDLLKYLCQGTHFLILGAYRDNEVNADHPAILAIEDIKKDGVAVNTIKLAPLDEEEITLLLEDSLKQQTHKCRELARLLLGKTKGNPFFLKEFLFSLYNSKLIEFTSDGWTWDLEKISCLKSAYNVVEFMVEQISFLPQKTQRLLNYGACVGNAFRTTTLVALNESSTKELYDCIKPALTVDMLVRINSGFQFSHDRIQEASYSLLSDEEKAKIHLKIGQLFLSETPPENLSLRVFEITNQLNLCLDLITDIEERIKLAELNLLAIYTAKRSSAFDSALNYSQKALVLLPRDRWTRCYSLTLSVYQEAVILNSILGNLDESDEYSVEILSEARSVHDKIESYFTKSTVCATLGQYDEMEEISVQALEELGWQIPSRKNSDMSDQVRNLLIETSEKLKDLTDQDIFSMPYLEDQKIVSVSRLMVGLWSSGYYRGISELMDYATFHLILLSLKHGLSPLSAFAFACHAVYLRRLNKLKSAFRWGELAVELSNKFVDVNVRGKVYAVFAHVCAIFGLPMREMIVFYKKSFSYNLESGDAAYIGWQLMALVWCRFCSGDPLNKVLQVNRDHAVHINKTKDVVSINIFKFQHHLFRALMGDTSEPGSLSSSEFDENLWFQEVLSKEYKLVESWYYCFKVQLCYLHEEYERAIEFTDLAEKTRRYTFELWWATEFVFYQGLALAAQWSAESPEQQKLFLVKIKEVMGKIKEWQDVYKVNFRHKYLLLSAEIARIEDRYLDALENYDLSIGIAHKQGFLHHEAIANELAALFFLKQGREKIARSYFVDAYQGYLRWGVARKLRVLEEHYSHLLFQEINRSGTVGISSTPFGLDLDLKAVLEASRILSSEINLQNLLTKFMKIIVETAGAQKGCLILEDQGVLKIEGAFDVESKTIQVLQSTPLEDSSRLPDSIIRYVARTGESVILHNASKQGPFIKEPFVVETMARSILCTSVNYKETQTGVLLLENRLSSNVFTKSRIKVLDMLLLQAAISIENARLYENQQSTRQALIESERGLVEYTDAMTTFNAKISTEGVVLWLNQTAAKSMGLSREKICGTFFKNMFWWSYDMMLQRQLLKAIKEAARGIMVNYPVRIQVDQGRFIIISFILQPVFNDKEQVKYLIAECRDITDLKLVEHQLRSHQEGLEALIKERTAKLGEVYEQMVELAHHAGKAEIASEVLHNVGNVLNSVNVIVEVVSKQIEELSIKKLERVVRLLEQKKERIGEFMTQDPKGILIPVFLRKLVDESNNEQARLTLDLTDLIKHIGHIKSIILMQQNYAKMGGLMELFSMHELIENAIYLNKSRFRHQNIKIEKDLCHCEQVYSNKQIIVQIIVNLLSNAIDSVLNSQKEDQRIWIKLSKPTQNKIRVEVIDNGVGILQENLTRIFSHGFTTKKDGHGFGLHSSANSAIQMGGSLTAHSAGIGKGARFVFELPFAKKEDKKNKEPERL